MKKVLLFTAMILLNATALFAQDEEAVPEIKFKRYNIGDGGVVEVMPDPSGSLNMKILYEQVTSAPLKAKERVGIDNSGGRFKGAMDKIKVRVLDGSGREMCKQYIYYNDFVLTQNEKGSPIIVLNFNSQGCGKFAYDKVENVIIEY